MGEYAPEIELENEAICINTSEAQNDEPVIKEVTEADAEACTKAEQDYESLAAALNKESKSCTKSSDCSIIPSKVRQCGTISVPHNASIHKAKYASSFTSLDKKIGNACLPLAWDCAVFAPSIPICKDNKCSVSHKDVPQIL